MITGIYQIRNLINGKVYIGQALDIIDRYSRHKYALNLKEYNSRLENRHLWNAWKKYGEGNFVLEIIKISEIEELDSLEGYYIRSVPKSERYNIRDEDPITNRGLRHTKETIEEMSRIKMGHLVSQETRDKISKNRKGIMRTNSAIEQHKNTLKERYNGTPSNTPVQQIDLITGKIVAEYPSQTYAERITGIFQANIYKVCRGKRHQAGGYGWQYKEEINNNECLA